MSNFMSALKSIAPKPTFPSASKPVEDAGNQAERELAEQQAQPSKTEPFYLDVPYMERHEAKKLGAWWNPSLKKWFVPAGVDRSPFIRWFTLSPGQNGFTPNSDDRAAYPATAPDPAQHATVTTVSGPCFAPFVPDYEAYRRQVDELTTALNMSAADLALYAVDYLYRANRNLQIQG